MFHPHQKECTLLKLTVYPLEIDPNMSLLLGGRELIGFCPENEARFAEVSRAPRSQNLLTPGPPLDYPKHHFSLHLCPLAGVAARCAD